MGQKLEIHLQSSNPVYEFKLLHQSSQILNLKIYKNNVGKELPSIIPHLQNLLHCNGYNQNKHQGKNFPFFLANARLVETSSLF